MEIVGEFLRIDTDKGIWNYFRGHWQELFPQSQKFKLGKLKSDRFTKVDRLANSKSMLKFYYQTLSLYSRPVWIALLEKKLPFELIELALDGDQWQPEFLAINPFGRVPVLVDDDFTVFESSRSTKTSL